MAKNLAKITETLNYEGAVEALAENIEKAPMVVKGLAFQNAVFHLNHKYGADHIEAAAALMDAVLNEDMMVEAAA